MAITLLIQLGSILQKMDIPDQELDNLLQQFRMIHSSFSVEKDMRSPFHYVHQCFVKILIS